MTKTNVTIANDFVSTLYTGSSQPPNGIFPCSNKSQAASVEQSNVPSDSSTRKEHKQSGTNGLSGKAKRKLRAAFVLLEQIYTKRCLSFLTCTVPSLKTRAAHELLNAVWGEIVRKFLQELKRLLKRKGLPDDYVNVTEIQEQRLLRRKLLCPHLHIVFVGRLHGKGWAISPTEIRELWNRIVSNHTDSEFDGSASTRIEQIKYSVRNYLTKYLSKGSVVNKVKEFGMIDQLPRRWYSMTQNLANAVEASIETLDESFTNYLERNLERFKRCGWIRWYFRVEKEFTDVGTNFKKTMCFAIVGSFSDDGLDTIKALFQRECPQRQKSSQMTSYA